MRLLEGGGVVIHSTKRDRGLVILLNPPPSPMLPNSEMSARSDKHFGCHISPLPVSFHILICSFSARTGQFQQLLVFRVRLTMFVFVKLKARDESHT